MSFTFYPDTKSLFVVTHRQVERH